MCCGSNVSPVKFYDCTLLGKGGMQQYRGVISAFYLFIYLYVVVYEAFFFFYSLEKKLYLFAVLNPGQNNESVAQPPF